MMWEYSRSGAIYSFGRYYRHRLLYCCDRRPNRLRTRFARPVPVFSYRHEAEPPDKLRQGAVRVPSRWAAGSLRAGAGVARPSRRAKNASVLPAGAQARVVLRPGGCSGQGGAQARGVFRPGGVQARAVLRISAAAAPLENVSVPARVVGRVTSITPFLFGVVFSNCAAVPAEVADWVLLMAT